MPCADAGDANSSAVSTRSVFMLDDRCFVKGAIQNRFTFLAHEKRLAWIAAHFVQVLHPAFVMANAVLFSAMESSLRKFRRDTDTRFEFRPQNVDAIFEAPLYATVVVRHPLR